MGHTTSVNPVRVEVLDFSAVTFGSDAYKRTCELRNDVLRKPLGLDLFNEDLSQEKEQSHFGLFDDDGQLIACVIAIRLALDTAKIRQMAVRSGYEGQGVGRALMRALEVQLAKDGVTKLMLHARLSAAGFYERLGYVRSGEPFVEVGIPHIRMKKSADIE
ncbi:MAG: GNAT family N-acetyltransferase [Pseudomonadota bacterium]